MTDADQAVLKGAGLSPRDGTRTKRARRLTQQRKQQRELKRRRAGT